MSRTYLGKLCAIIISYHPGDKFKKTFSSIFPQVDKVFVVDNGSNQETISLLKRLQHENPQKTRIILNGENLGVAKAQNIGLEHALEENFDWTLLLDHDSEAYPDMIDNMGRAFNDHPEGESIGLIAPYLRELNVESEPHYIVANHKILFKTKPFGENPVMDDVLCVIATGSLIRMDVIRKLGKFREDFFIDYVDSEFCMSLITHGWKLMVVRDAVLAHTLGNKKLHNFLGLKIITTNHSPERRFTIYRNRVYLWKKYLFRVPAYIIFDISAAGYDLLSILLFERNRAQKLAQAARGLVTGFFGTEWCNERL